MNIEQEIQNLKAKIYLLEQELQKEKGYDWDNAPVICQHDGFEYRLGPQWPFELEWDVAVDWCKSVGGELPDRQILLACYMNGDIRAEFTASVYWSNTEFSTTSAWYQGFDDGLQYPNDVTNSYSVRAVKKFEI